MEIAFNLDLVKSEEVHDEQQLHLQCAAAINGMTEP